ncbi:hypothetical protein BDZ45DRAFT_723957 [Acephala macrosclerotiorum]|nr:hypothetical protein BDZ45DRAFT_723957 [Acephala macrosclerotiorum]
MTIDVHIPSVPHNSIKPVTSTTNSDLTLVDVQQASGEGEIMARTEPDTYSSQTTTGSAAGSPPVAIPHPVSMINTDHRNRKSLFSGINHLSKFLLSKQLKVNVATLISVALAILAVVYTVLSDNVGQKQLDLGMWTFCKSYSDDPQVQNSTACQMYSRKTSLDELRRRDSTRLPESSVQILDSVPDWLSVPSRIDRQSCQVVCWNSASSHTHVVQGPARVSKSYLNVVDSIRSMVFESAIPRLRMVIDSSRRSYTAIQVKIRSFVLESAIPRLKIAIGSPAFSCTGVVLSVRSFILDSVTPQLRTAIGSPKLSYMEVMESIRSLIFVDSIRSLIFDPAFPQIAIVLRWPKISYVEVANSIRSQIFDSTLRKHIVIDVVLWLGLKALAPGVILVAQLIYQYGMLLVKILCCPVIRLIIVLTAAYLAILVVFNDELLSK